MTRRRALVVTVVHHPADARIRARQIGALLAAGWQVTYAAPFSGYALPVPPPQEAFEAVDLTRARGRSRLGALRAARRLLRARAAGHDVVLLHDPELLAATVGLRLPTTVVWDVHEDTAAAIETKEWLPGPLRRGAAVLTRGAERLAERRLPLLLADDRYQDRFRRTPPVVPNTTRVPEAPAAAASPGPDDTYRVVYLGSLTIARGAEEVVEVARRLHQPLPGRPRVRTEVIGPAHGRAEELLTAASSRGELDWTGYLPNDEALARVEGAVAGLSLLHDEKNFRPSLPTKVAEYLARGVPVVTTPLPVAVDLVERSGGGVVVPFGPEGVEAAVRAVRSWCADPAGAAQVGRAGHAFAREHLDWAAHGPAFVAELERLAAGVEARR